MREIKFRAWNKSIKIFFKWDLTFSFNGTDKMWSHPEQYIGLTDKNGKEIYEGDVLNVKCRDGGMVEWPNHLVKWENIQGYIGYWIPEQTHDRPGKHEHSIEIVGNVHQNPDWITKFTKQ